MMRLIHISIFLFISVMLSAQSDTIKRFDHVGLVFKYGYDLPFADMGDRFGNNNQAGVGIEFYNAELNLFSTIEFNFLFGNQVKQDVLSDLRLDNGNILAVSGRYGSVFLRERGSYIGLSTEKVLGNDLYGRGLRLGIGIGVLTHKIRVQNDTNDVPQVRGEYESLYDHKTSGFATKQSIAYNFANKSRRSLFAVGLDFTQGFTSNVRAVNKGSEVNLGDKSLDLIIGLNVRWTLPLNRKTLAEDIYY